MTEDDACRRYPDDGVVSYVKRIGDVSCNAAKACDPWRDDGTGAQGDEQRKANEDDRVFAYPHAVRRKHHEGGHE
jgi:hypothetical protein